MVEYEIANGLIRNPFHILDAVNDSISRDAMEVYNEDGMDYSVAMAIGPDKVLMDTGYLDANTLIGVHNASIRFYTPSSVTYPIIFEYWFLAPDGTEGSVTVNTIFQNDIGDEWGRGIGFAYFHENYQYRIIVRTHSSLGEDEYVWVDYVKLTAFDPKTPSSMYAAASSTDPEVPAIQVERSGWENFYGDGSSYTYQQTYNLGATPQRAHITVTAYSVLGITANIYNVSAPYFTVRAWRTNGSSWSGTISIFWKASCWETVTSLK